MRPLRFLGWMRWRQGVEGLRNRAFRSVTFRILFFTASATLLTSLAITWTSAQSVSSFLRGKLEYKFPSILRATEERLGLWYSQRRLDLHTFARSDTLRESVARVGPGARGQRARVELEAYLSFVHERFPQYEALFVLDASSDLVVWVGREIAVEERLFVALGQVVEAGSSPFHVFGDRRIQFVSAVIEGKDGKRHGSVHAALDAIQLQPLLRSTELSGEGDIFLLDVSGAVVAGARARDEDDAALPDAPAAGEAPVVREYRSHGGRHVIGAASRLEDSGWTLVVEEPYEDAFAPLVAIVRRTLAINLGIVLLFGAAAWRITSSIVRPIRSLSAVVQRVREGEMNVQLPEASGDDEVGLLTQAFRDMMRRLGDVHERLSERNLALEAANEVLEQLSITDGLTKLHNHRFFQDHLGREVKRARRTGEPLSLLLLDVDDFKRLNDKHGHATGDAVLREVAEVLSMAVRETDLLARYGGEEFAVVASGTDLLGAELLAEKLRLTVYDASFVSEDGEPIRVTLSAGVGTFHGVRESLFRDADQALYRAKTDGKDCVRSTEPETV